MNVALVDIHNSELPRRPALRWHGGKWRLAPWIIAHFPPHRIYVEPFGGAASVLLRKPRSYAEVYNDLDEEVVNLFRVLRDPERGGALVEQLRLTPFARAEFDDAGDLSDEPIERGRRLVIRSFMGFGSNAHSSAGRFQSGTRAIPRNGAGNYRSTGFRSNSFRLRTTPAHDWVNYPEALKTIIGRLAGVVIESRDAREVMAQHDSPATLHYVDPPYLPETRAPSNKYGLKHRMYRHELTKEDHAGLLEFLRRLVGMIVLSGYPSALYDEALADWRRVTTETYADGARPRTEVLWLNPASAAAIEAQQSSSSLFDVAGGLQ